MRSCVGSFVFRRLKFSPLSPPIFSPPPAPRPQRAAASNLKWGGVGGDAACFLGAALRPLLSDVRQHPTDTHKNTKADLQIPIKNNNVKTHRHPPLLHVHAQTGSCAYGTGDPSGTVCVCGEFQSSKHQTRPDCDLQQRRPLSSTLNIDAVKLCRLFIDWLQRRNEGGWVEKKKSGPSVWTAAVPRVISLTPECLNLLRLLESRPVIPEANKQSWKLLGKNMPPS